MEIFEVRFEIYLNEQLSQVTSMVAPKDAIIMQFLNLAKQIRDIPEKAKIKLIRPELIWIPWDKKHITLDNIIEIQNYTE